MRAVPGRRQSHVLTTRQRAPQLAGLLGFARQAQTRNAISESARHAFCYAGKVACRSEGQTSSQHWLMRRRDPGGHYHATPGLSGGMIRAQRLSEPFPITAITLMTGEYPQRRAQLWRAT